MSLVDCGLQPFGALKGGKRKASHLRGFSLVGAPGALDLVAYSADVFR